MNSGLLADDRHAYISFSPFLEFLEHILYPLQAGREKDLNSQRPGTKSSAGTKTVPVIIWPSIFLNRYTEIYTQARHMQIHLLIAPLFIRVPGGTASTFLLLALGVALEGDLTSPRDT